MLNIGVIGVGYWGPNIIRNFTALPDSNVVLCADVRKERLDFITSLYPKIEVTTCEEDVIKDKRIDAVAIVTPVSTHFKLAKESIENGKHLLLEKPMCGTIDECKELVDLAYKKNKIIMVDHTFIYHPAIKKCKELIEIGELGDKLFYFDSVRINLGLFQHDINVIWDLAPHDLSIMDYLINEKPVAVSACGAAHFRLPVEDVAYITVKFESQLIAHFQVSWLAPVKIRRTVISGSSKMLVYDDMDPSEKIKIYDKGITVNESIYETLISYRTGDMWAPKISTKEALRDECEHFLDCVMHNKKPITDAENGLRIVRLLGAADESIKSNGCWVSCKE
ncbi:MAG: Gfo/Idh/MocA family oxidoreductase [Candidatus Coatesbacteria bacterium]|nr:Gfo/Idh/MocA family oxidoreductase [Candidatus Coatesbacteria bacterium]